MKFLQPLIEQLSTIWIGFVKLLPMLGIALFVLLVTWFAATILQKLIRASLKRAHMRRSLIELLLTLAKGEHVERFDEVEVGDIVQVDYLASVAREFREPTEEEKAEPFVILEEVGKVPADLGLPPGAGGLRVIRAVCVVEAMNRLDNTAVLRGPRGNLFEVDVQNPDRFDDVELGDTIVVTYTEAMAVTLKKHSAG